MTTFKKIRAGLKRNLVDCTAMLAIANPVYTLLEKTLLKMPDALSQNARLTGACITYAGIGVFSTIVRDKSRSFFKITQESSEKLIGIHDTIFGTIFGATITTGMYYALGRTSLEQIATGAGTAAAISLALSYPCNYAVDSFRDFTDIERSPRLPRKIQCLPSKYKKVLGSLIVAGSLATLPIIYHYTPTYQNARPETYEQK